MLKKFMISFIFIMLTGPIAGAHPHLFIEISFEIIFDDKGMAGLEETWVFDEMFSASIIEEQDKNKDGKFDTKEIETLKKEAFNNLKDFDYFTYIRINSKAFKAAYVTKFKPSIKKNKLVYTFVVPCHVTATEKAKKIEISIFDTSYFTAVSMMDETAQVKGRTEHFDIQSNMYRNKEFIVMEQDGFPETMILKMRKK